MLTLHLLTDDRETTSAHRRLWRAVQWFVLYSDIQTAEVVSGLIAIWWGLVLLAPGDLLMTTPAFAGLQLVFYESQWAAVSATVALLSVAGLAATVLATERTALLVRRAALLAAVWYYTTISAAIAGVQGANTGVGVYGVIAVASAWGYWRLGLRTRGARPPNA